MKTIGSVLTSVSAVVLLGVAPMTPTIAAESTEQAKEVKEKIEALRVEAAGVRRQVGMTLEALNRMQSESVDLREQFKQFTDALAKMEAQAKVARERAETMGKEGQAFFKAWEEQIGSIGNPEVRELAKSRYDKRTKSYQKIIVSMTEVREVAKPFMSDLNDIKTLLGSELSRETVTSAKKLIQQADLRGGDVWDALVDVETQLDRVGGELAKYK
jgi:septal ring factor EnvC (AmiA/AmiB activator)